MARLDEFGHVSVMLGETVDSLNVRKNCIYLDGTMGGAGHSSEIMRRLDGSGHLYGVDQDEDAIEAGSERLEPYKEHVTIIRDNYRNAVARLKELGVTGVDGILLDLGVSSYQLDKKERGFSYKEDTTLDMRMDRRQTVTAKDIVNGYSEAELYRIIRDYGEDNFAKNIAKHICMRRGEREIETTGELAEIIKESIPAKLRKNGHPAKKTFQAIRIECNRELEVLRDSLSEMIDFLNPGGRISIITFHSLEDRIVKNAFRTAENPCICPPSFPVCTCGRKPKGKQVFRKPVLPSEDELLANSRSKSAKLRSFEKF